MKLKPCRSPYCECSIGKCTHPGYFDARAVPINQKPLDMTTQPVVESDPHNVDQHSPGAKLDAGKQLPKLVLGGFIYALKEVVKVGTFGANKYTPNGWKEVQNGKERYYEAALRHLMEDLASPESVDEQTNISHLAHAAWNLLAIITLRVLSSSQSRK